MIYTKKNNVGGEIEITPTLHHYETTLCGRSSLRLIIKSMNLAGKKVLIPDFICQVVIDILLEENIQIHHYKIEKNLEFSLPTNTIDFDCIYFVKFFGHTSKAFNSFVEKAQVPFIYDCVFDFEMPEIKSDAHWCCFNSLRKITYISGYSQIISNKKISSFSLARLNHFSEMKYDAKEIKYNYLMFGLGEDVQYVDLFNKSEDFLRLNNGIYFPDARSIKLTVDFSKKLEMEKNIRKKNLLYAKERFNQFGFIDIDPEFPSFLPLIINNKKRNLIRFELMKKNIFLAVHWPKPYKVSNALSDSLLSIPLDARYTEDDIDRVYFLMRKLV